MSPTNDQWCEGGGTLPRHTMENDWWVGPTGRCESCGRMLKLAKKTGRLPRHKRYDR